MIKLRYQKQAKYFVALISLSLVVLWSCNDIAKNEEILPPSTGHVGEVLVIVDTTSWKSDLGDSIRVCFSSPQSGLPETEPMFNVVHIVPRAFTDIFKTTGNIISIEINPDQKPGYLIEKNIWAKNQQFVKIVARDRAEASRIVGKSKETLREIFIQAGFNRRKKALLASHDKGESEKLFRKLGVKLYIPKGFKRGMESDNAIYWRRDQKKGAHSIISGLIVYKTTYKEATDLHMNHLLSMRDSVTKQLIKGAEPGYYMEVERRYEPDSANREVDGKYGKQIRGLWRMNEGFMGGPFVNLTIADDGSSELVVIDGFVYCPRYSKRKFIRELEAIMNLAELQ